MSGVLIGIFKGIIKLIFLIITVPIVILFVLLGSLESFGADKRMDDTFGMKLNEEIMKILGF